MEIRRIAIIAALFVCRITARAEAIHTNALDDRLVHLIRISREEPTTCMFPGALTALEGANLSAQSADAPPVLLSYQPGASFFSVRALCDNARAAVNVVFRGRIFALTFECAPEADRAVSFRDDLSVSVPTPASTAATATPAILHSLVDRAKHHDLIAAQYPALTRNVERAAPNSVTLYPGFAVILTDVFRFDAEDTLVFRVRVDNPQRTAIRFDPSGLAVRVGPTIYPTAFSEASGEVAPNSSGSLWFAIAGGPQGGRANLSVRNTFFVLVPRLP
jgi:hypothetical protein